MAYKRWSRFCIPAAVVVAILSVLPAQAGNTTCVSNQLSWYTSVVGESPCMTYQRLRQICNNDYQVPSFSLPPPGDRCDEQLSACCCNTIAFYLSMLCMDCQLDTQDTGGNGIDAQAGTYGVYLKGCSPVVNNTLPSSIQSAVCNENIRLDSFLYNLGWAVTTGNWFYAFAREAAEKDHAAYNNNTFTHCPNQVSPSPTPTTSSSNALSNPTSNAGPNTTSNATPNATSTARGLGADTQRKSKSNAPLIGGVVGGVLSLAFVALGVIICMRRKTHSHGALVDPLILNAPGTEGRDPWVSHGSSGRRKNTIGPSQAAVNSPDTSFRRDGGGPPMRGLIRSNSGSLPPAYDDPWDSDERARPTAHPNAGALPMPPFDSRTRRLREGKRGVAFIRPQ